MIHALLDLIWKLTGALHTPLPLNTVAIYSGVGIHGHIVVTRHPVPTAGMRAIDLVY